MRYFILLALLLAFPTYAITQLCTIYLDFLGTHTVVQGEEPAVTARNLQSDSRAGDNSAKDRLILLLAPKMYAVISNIIRNRDDNTYADLVQETFLKMLPRLYNSNIDPLPYALVSAKNMAISYLRHKNRQQTVPILKNDEFKEIENFKHETLEKQGQKVILFLEKLSPEEKVLFNMLYVQGLTQREVATRLGIHEGNLSRRNGALIKKIRNALNPEIEDQ